MKRNVTVWLLIPTTVLFLYFLIHGINTPFVGPNATNYNWYSLIAHNYVKLGFYQTKLLQILYPATSLHDIGRVYLHHPPLISIFEAIFFIFFGEHFWSGRLVVILFTLGSSILFFFIGKSVKNTQFGFLALLISCLIPATSIFGSMIGQEPLVLLFGLLTIFAMLTYQKTKKKLFLYVAILSVILGTFSDWPMVYFTLAFLPYFFFTKERRLGLTLVFVSILSALSFVLYSFFYYHGLSDLHSAFTTRSLGTLLSQPYWPLKWIGIIIIRFFLYFNPIVVVFAFIALVTSMKKKMSAGSYILLGFFLFGLIHIFLYPEGSFGHPYWTYYMLPFFIFGSAEFIELLQQQKRYFILVLLLLCSIIWVLKVEDWKTKQIDANLWRYGLMQQAEKYLPLHEKIVINTDSAIDSDLIEYVHLQPVSVRRPSDIRNLPNTLHYYLLSCTNSCLPKYALLLLSYKWHHVKNAGGEAYVIDLRTGISILPHTELPLPHITLPSSVTKGAKALYQHIKDLLHAPQL